MPQSSTDSKGVYREQISFNHNLVAYEIESFLKSVKNHESPRSRASNIMCSRYTKALWVDFPEIANCLGSRCDVIHGRTLKSVNLKLSL